MFLGGESVALQQFQLRSRKARLNTPADLPLPGHPSKSSPLRCQVRPDGSVLLSDTEALADYPRRLTDRLVDYASSAPARSFLACRDATGAWQHLSYAQTLQRVQAIASALLARPLSAERPIVILSGNDLDHAVLALAALSVGIPYAPISPSYAKAGAPRERLQAMLDLLTPGLVFAADGAACESWLSTLGTQGVEVWVSKAPPLACPATLFKHLLTTPVAPGLQAALDAVGPDHIAKFMFSSGTTGRPKCVITTQRMLCASQQMFLQSLPDLGRRPPVLLDWLPWHHAFGGNRNFGAVLYNGGTLYVDDGRPLPGQFQRTLENMAEINPTALLSVPRSFEFLNTKLGAHPELARQLLGNLDFLFFAGAGLAQPVLEGLQHLAEATLGRPLRIFSGIGCTEASPGLTFTGEGYALTGHLGTPHPGLEFKLAPVGSKLEARVRGPNITPGYWRDDAMTAQARDEEGYFRTGDALRLVDAQQPSRGLLFDGRVAEDFKLSSGTWVSVGPLRARLVELCAPLLRDVVITGLNRNELGALLFPDMPACRALVPELPFGTPDEVVLAHPRLRERLQQALGLMAREASGSATHIKRALLMTEAPTVESGEATDKGSLNCAAVLERRAALVDRLYSGAGNGEMLQPSDRLT